MTESIPFALPSVTDDDIEAVTSVLRSGWLTTGEQCVAFEQELATYLGAPHVIAVASCTHALVLLLASLGLPAGSRVGVPTWTFVSSALAAVHTGLDPVLLDIDPDTLQLAPDSLESSVDDLAAVVGVHFGGSAMSPAVREICAAKDVPLVEDAAHALGTSDDRGVINGFGTVGAAFSFYATKNLTSAEGGAIATHDEQLASFARSHRQHGLSSDAWRRYLPDGSPLYDLEGAGWKMNLPDVLAALARSQLHRFDEMQARRRAAVDRYRRNLAESRISPVPLAQDPKSADHLFVVLLPEGNSRSSVVQRLSAAGIGTSVHFQPLHRFDWVRQRFGTAASGTPGADLVADRALSLPLYADITETQVDRVCEAVLDAVGP